MNPFEGIASVINAFIYKHDVDKWVTKFYAIGLSVFAAYEGAAGRALHNGATELVARGDGMIAIATVITVAITLDSRLRGSFVITKENATEAMNSGAQEIEKK